MEFATRAKKKMYYIHCKVTHDLLYTCHLTIYTSHLLINNADFTLN